MAAQTLLEDCGTVKQSRKCARCRCIFFRTCQSVMQWRVASRRCDPCEREHIKDRLKSRVLIQDGCWNWQGSICPCTGYGKISVHDRPIGTHRLSYELFCGPIPRGMSVLHKCDNRRCINPDHLFLGSQVENVRDMWNKGRGVKPPTHFGVSNSNATLTDGQVDQLRSEYASKKIKQRDLAKKYGISQSTVWRLVHGITRTK